MMYDRISIDPKNCRRQACIKSGRISVAREDIMQMKNLISIPVVRIWTKQQEGSWK
jgi:hypothetical protein